MKIADLYATLGMVKHCTSTFMLESFNHLLEAFPTISNILPSLFCDKNSSYAALTLKTKLNMN